MKSFLKDNREELIKLCDIIRNETDLAKLDETVYNNSEDFKIDILARKKARKFIEIWISEAFSEAYSIPLELLEDENIYRILEEENKNY